MAHLGAGLQGIKETGWEKVLFAPVTANFPAPRDPPNLGSPHPSTGRAGWAGFPWPKPAGPWGQEPRHSQHPGCGHTPQPELLTPCFPS